ncbi:MAG: transcription antitermination factor NusB [Lachnospiraceae bacterium]|nr:transcription antitermination factor NusB [Lachnospiraceae bacterium]
MGRRGIREQVFKLLFRVEFNAMEEMEEQCQLFFQDDDLQVSEKEEKQITEKFQNASAKLEEIDQLLNDTVEGWTTSRMGKVELAILRLAVYEMKYDSQIPEGVAINEAVELAKKYGQDESSKFVNAVLAKLVEAE